MLHEPSPFFTHGTVTVSSSAATALDANGLAATNPVRGIQLKAPTGNTGIIYVGGSNVTTANGYPLNKGDSIFIPISDLRRLFFLAATNGDLVSYLIY